MNICRLKNSYIFSVVPYPTSDLPVHFNLPGENGEYPVSYFWQEICQKDNWLRIFYSFVYVETKEVADSSGKVQRKETQIFPVTISLMP